MTNEDKLKEIYESMLNEAPGKGFTITCDKCGQTGKLLKNNKMMPTNTKIEIMPGAEEDEDSGGSLGYVNFKCNKCGQSMVVDE